MELPEGCEYVALGSSYAAGPGLGDRVAGSPWRAARSERGGDAAAYHPLRSGMIAVADAVEAALSAA